MENIKEELGKKIRGLRESKGLSRAEFCDTEAELTVRQLARIEAGESLPTLPKLGFISKQLCVPIGQLVDERHVELPRRYEQLKEKLYKMYTYKEEKLVGKKENYFLEIYDTYYDKLPEEEQVIIDVQQAVMIIHLTKEAAFGEELLEDYFSQLLLKKNYSINDLLIINLYFHYIHYKDYDEKTFNYLFDNLVNHIEDYNQAELIVLNRVALTASSIFLEFNYHDRLLDAIDFLNNIIQVSQDFQKKPIVKMLEGKYWLFSQKNWKKAEDKYRDSIQCAKLFGDKVLSDKLLKEWQDDLERFRKGEF
ncbi:helix-turn-helix domain-containing protein [Enterococcus sp. LJL51]|uniref:helix-turn-helix domain-containing protein n=1 Tax=Enterococcus sp. LJL51 TaxID=3416656 RepID=UPI003CF6D06B